MALPVPPNQLQSPDIHYTWKLFKLLLPLLGYKQEPITTLTLTYRHPRGTRIGINTDKWWWNQ